MYFPLASATPCTFYLCSVSSSQRRGNRTFAGSAVRRYCESSQLTTKFLLWFTFRTASSVLISCGLSGRLADEIRIFLAMRISIVEMSVDLLAEFSFKSKDLYSEFSSFQILRTSCRKTLARATALPKEYWTKHGQNDKSGLSGYFRSFATMWLQLSV